jgi:hypothetical protein
MHHIPADYLHVEMAYLERTARRFAHTGKGFWQNVFKGVACRKAVAELVALLTQIFIRELLKLWLKRVNGLHNGLSLLNECMGTLKKVREKHARMIAYWQRKISATWRRFFFREDLEFSGAF